MGEILDGKLVSGKIKENLKKEIDNNNYKIKLVVILVGEDPASQIYVNSKNKTCIELGITSEIIKKPSDISQEKLLDLIRSLNDDAQVDGILCQLPVPKHIDENIVINTISPEKDVDCFHPINTGNLFCGNPTILPCTPAGCIEILKHYNIPIKGKRCVIIGRSNIAGKPLAQLLMMEHGTITICHSRTVDIPKLVGEADILCTAIGIANFVRGEDVKDGAVIIDIGMNRVEDDTKKSGYRLCGDVEFETAKEKASYITPVPGGVGPMTIACLMQNVVRCHQIRKK